MLKIGIKSTKRGKELGIILSTVRCYTIPGLISDSWLNVVGEAAEQLLLNYCLGRPRQLSFAILQPFTLLLTNASYWGTFMRPSIWCFARLHDERNQFGSSWPYNLSFILRACFVIWGCPMATFLIILLVQPIESNFNLVQKLLLCSRFYSLLLLRVWLCTILS